MRRVALTQGHARSTAGVQHEARMTTQNTGFQLAEIQKFVSSHEEFFFIFPCYCPYCSDFLVSPCLKKDYTEAMHGARIISLGHARTWRGCDMARVLLLVRGAVSPTAAEAATSTPAATTATTITTKTTQQRWHQQQQQEDDGDDDGDDTAPVPAAAVLLVPDWQSRESENAADEFGFWRGGTVPFLKFKPHKKEKTMK